MMNELSTNRKETIVRILPIAVLLIIFTAYFVSNNGGAKSSSSHTTKLLKLPKEETCATCPDGIVSGHCFDSSSAVLGGVDFVQYFTSFKVETSSVPTYNESMVGQVGDPTFSSTYNGHEFHFLSNENKKIFEQNPSKFVPQFGGFCSWGVSAEFCPSYPWSKDCLGPAGSWAQWTIQNDKLYFFYVDKAKYQFMMDPTTYIAAGNTRWAEFYGEKAESTFNTACYVKE